MNEKKNRKKNIILAFIIAILATFSAAAAIYIYINLRSKDENPNPNVSVEKIESDGKDERNGEGVSLQYAGYVTLESDQDLITLHFANPSRSTKSLSLEIVANIDGSEVSLAKTDIIRPGNKITSAKYTSDKEITKGTYPGKFVVHFYGDEDKEEIVVTNIDIKVYVK